MVAYGVHSWKKYKYSRFPSDVIKGGGKPILGKLNPWYHPIQGIPLTQTSVRHFVAFLPSDTMVELIFYIPETGYSVYTTEQWIVLSYINMFQTYNNRDHQLYRIMTYDKVNRTWTRLPLNTRLPLGSDDLDSNAIIRQIFNNIDQVVRDPRTGRFERSDSFHPLKNNGLVADEGQNVNNINTNPLVPRR